MQDTYIQTELERQTETGLQKQVVWLPVDDPPFKQGQVIRLRGENEYWTVARLFTRLPKHVLHTDWRVGGLE